MVAFNIPKTHSTSFLTLFAENADSLGELVCEHIYGQIVVSHCN